MAPLLLAIALSATVSTSKLGVFVVGDVGSSTAPNPIIATCPATAVFPFDITDQNPAATIGPGVAAYVAACPGGRVILRLGTAGLGLQSIAQQFPQLPTTIQSIGLRANLDAVEIPFTIGTPIEVATYWAQLAQQLSPLYLPLIGAGTVTNPSSFCPLVTAITSQNFDRFGIAFQEVTPMTFTTSDSAFMFNQVSLACAAAGVPLAGFPMFVTQLSPLSGVWDSNAMSWLAWFDQQLTQFPSMAGAALFQLGGAPDITNIGPLLINYFPNPVVPDGGIPDGGSDAGGSGGQVQPSHGSAGGTLSPPSAGCSTAGPAFLGLAAIPVIFALRRRTRRR